MKNPSVDTQIVKAVNSRLSILAVICGGFGMAACVPYLLMSNWTIVGAAGIVFLGGAVLYAAGSICLTFIYRD